MLSDFWNLELWGNGAHIIRVSNVFYVLLLLLLARLVFWYFKRGVLNRYYRRNQVDEGRAFSITQLFRYLFYIIIGLAAMQTLGIQITVLYAALAALLVGIGIGLQQTFNDFTSGIILLIEGSIRVGDWLDVNGTIGKVKHIGLRTSQIETIRGIAVIVPNSKITIENVINLRGFNRVIQHSVTVGVAYGSDTQQVHQILLDCAKDTIDIVEKPAPFVRFVDFGNSSLDFELLFYSGELRGIEDVKSNLRFRIDRAFRSNDIEIPFPQTDLNLKNLPIDLSGNLGGDAS